MDDKQNLGKMASNTVNVYATADLRAQPVLDGPGCKGQPGGAATLHKSAGAVVTDGIVHIDQFIPLRYPDLRDRLIEDFPEAFYDPKARAQFFALADRISLRNQIRMMQAFRELQEQYAFLDPDVDVELPNPGARMTDEARQYLSDQFEAGLAALFAKGGFEELSKEELHTAFQKTGVANGMSVLPPNPDKLEYRCYCRGKREVKVGYSSWRTLWFTKYTKVSVLQRLAIVFKINVPDAESALVQRRKEGWFRRTFINPFKYKRYQVAENPIKPEWTYIKLFKDIEIADVDMLLPGSVIKFSWFDYLMIWGPILFGLGSAIYKSATGTVDFSSYENMLTSLVLIVVPITWGIRAYFAIKEKEQAYEAYMNKLLLLHNLNNNAGVISQMLDGAREQEDNEALLAYFFLWQGQVVPHPMPRCQLDARVEDYLNCTMKEAMGDKAGRKQKGSKDSKGSGEKQQQEKEKPAAGVGLARRNQVAPQEEQQQQQQQQQGGQQGDDGGQKSRSLDVMQALDNGDVSEFTIDFDVSDAVAKLAEMEVLRQVPAAAQPGGDAGDCGGDAMLQVLGLDAAVEALALQNLRQPGTAATCRSTRAEGPSMWHECYATYPYTGQTFKFFFNPQTGESCYDEPSGPYIPAAAAAHATSVTHACPWPLLAAPAPQK